MRVMMAIFASRDDPYIPIFDPLFIKEKIVAEYLSIRMKATSEGIVHKFCSHDISVQEELS